jgi:hypothetical protein
MIQNEAVLKIFSAVVGFTDDFVRFEPELVDSEPIVVSEFL